MIIDGKKSRLHNDSVLDKQVKSGAMNCPEQQQKEDSEFSEFVRRKSRDKAQHTVLEASSTGPSVIRKVTDAVKNTAAVTTQSTVLYNSSASSKRVRQAAPSTKIT